MDYLHKCHKGHKDCFAYCADRDGCIALERTRFPDGKDCPFYKSRDEVPDYDAYVEEYMPKRRESK